MATAEPSTTSTVPADKSMKERAAALLRALYHSGAVAKDKDDKKFYRVLKESGLKSGEAAVDYGKAK
jgi:hypothetical protein